MMFSLLGIYLVKNKSIILLSTWLLSCFILFQMFSVNFLSILLVNKETPIESLKDLVNLDVKLLVLKNTYQSLKMQNESWSIMSKVTFIEREMLTDHKLFDNSKNVLMTYSSMTEVLKEVNQDLNLKRTEGNGSFTLAGLPTNKNLDQRKKQKLHLL